MSYIVFLLSNKIVFLVLIVAILEIVVVESHRRSLHSAIDRKNDR